MSDNWQEHRRRVEQAAESVAASSATVARSAHRSAVADEQSAFANARSVEVNERSAFYNQVTAAASLGSLSEARATRWATEKQTAIAGESLNLQKRTKAEQDKLQREWKCPNCGKINGTNTIIRTCNCGQAALGAIFFLELESKNGELCSKCNAVKLKGSDCLECIDRQRCFERLEHLATPQELNRLRSESEVRFVTLAEQAKSQYESRVAQMEVGYTQASHQLQTNMATTGKISSIGDIKQFFNLLRLPIIVGVASWAVIALLSALTSGGGSIAWLLLLICGIGPALTKLKIPATWKQVGIATVIELVVLIVFVSIFAGSNIVLQIVVFPLSLLVAGVTGPLAVVLLNADAINRRHAHYQGNLNQLNQQHPANMQREYDQYLQTVSSTKNKEERELSQELANRQNALRYFKRVVLPSRIDHDLAFCECTTRGKVSEHCV